MRIFSCGPGGAHLVDQVSRHSGDRRDIFEMGYIAGLILLVALQCACLASPAAGAQGLGSWNQLLDNAGISSMHSMVTRFDTVILLDHSNIGPSQIKLPNNVCRNQTLEKKSRPDCYAHTVMFDPAANTVRPLYIFTDTQCSSGQFIADGTMVQTGGAFEGDRIIRRLKPCPASGSCDWVEQKTILNEPRWYSTNQLLQTGRQIVVGGRSRTSYEFLPKRRSKEASFTLSILQGSNNNLYPFVFLLPNGHLFIFSNRNSVMLDHVKGIVLYKYPTIPGNSRTYPSGGSAVLLPLSAENDFTKAEVLICGGASALKITALGSKSCGKIDTTTDGGAVPQWQMEDMPSARIMGDMLNMPNGEVYIINGAAMGFQSWEAASVPALEPVSYDPTKAEGVRFSTLAPSSIPRMYHSTASLLADGRVLCAGSNPLQFYSFTGKPFLTELRLDAFSPPYLETQYDLIRPTISSIPEQVRYRKVFRVKFKMASTTAPGVVEVNMRSSPFGTHSFSQGQRLVKLRTSGAVKKGAEWVVSVAAVPNANLAPPAYYMFYVVHSGIPSKARWVRQSK